MNTPDPTLNPELLDELISADLDGEFDRAATELGYSPAAARAAVDATPGAVARRAALARARDQLATRPALAARDQQRLVASALDRDPADIQRVRRRRAERHRFRAAGRVLAAVGSAAAVIAVIFALAASNPGSSSKSSVASAPGVQSAAPRRPAAAKSRSAAFGDVSHAGALRRQVKAALAAPPRRLESPAPTPFAGEPSATGVDSSPKSTVRGAQDVQGDLGLLAAATPRGLLGADGVVVNGPLTIAAPTAPPTRVLAPLTTQRCIAAGTHAARLHSSPAITGFGTYAGKPAVVVVFGRARAYVAYVLSVPGCSVLIHVVVP
jgi:hypothetical protein